MKQTTRVGILIIPMLLVAVITGCLDSSGNENEFDTSSGNEFNTNTPVEIEVGLLSSQYSNKLYIMLRDFDQNMTTSNGVATITIFKGNFKDNDLDKVNEFVLSESYDVNRNDFRQIKTVCNRDIEYSALMWTAQLPFEFNPEIFDVYKLIVYFEPVNKNHRLVNQTYICWDH